MANKHDVQLELTVLATILDGEDVLGQTLMVDLGKDHYGHKLTKEIYRRIMSMAGLGKDLPSRKVLALDPALSRESKELLVAEVDPFNTLVDVENAIDSMEQFRKIRHIFKGVKTATISLKGEHIDNELIQKAVGSMEEAVSAINATQSYKRIVHAGMGSNSRQRILDIINSPKPDFIKSHFDEFDDRAGGFNRGSLVIIASSRGGGKSTVAMQIAINNYLNDNRKVCTMLYELDEDEYMGRVLANISGIDYNLVRNHKYSPSQKIKVINAWNDFDAHGQANDCRFTVMCPPTGSVTEALRMIRPYQYDIVIWDMLTLMDSPNPLAPQWEKLGEIARILKVEASAQKNVHIGLAQLSPDMQVKYARAIEEHANNVWGWRYGDQEAEEHRIPVRQLKSRGSQPFDFNLQEDFAHMRISDWQGISGSSADLSMDDDDDDVSGISMGI